ncbi:hypothetical protein HPB47_004541 [Ixodes persulcatus]|uniref:Uncharacterized protein n=1 Tax=Ixodes persulcatus TaxID=34615 RepID=A0AC60PGE0_IXOPE|nr:hypothetical protein HPB47_004541 [Ixodes persulcatus]
MAEAGPSSGQDIPSVEMEELPMGTSSASSTISYYESISDDPGDDSDLYNLVQSRKKRKASSSSETSNTTVKNTRQEHPHLVVVLKPKDPSKIIATINPLKITEKLEMTAPDGIILVRPNRRLNLLAIDTRNRDATKALLALTTIGGIPVQAYKPFPRESAIGVVYGVPSDINDTELQVAIRATAPVISVRRLGTSQVVKSHVAHAAGDHMNAPAAMQTTPSARTAAKLMTRHLIFVRHTKENKRYTSTRAKLKLAMRQRKRRYSHRKSN